MEQSITKFVERVFSGNPDFGALTKAELRRQYFKEHGLSHFNKEQKQLFATIVNKMIVEHAEAIEEAAKKKSSLAKSSSSRVNGSVDEHTNNTDTARVSNGVEKNVVVGSSVKGKPKNNIHNNSLKKTANKTENKHVYRSDDDDDGGGGGDTSDPEALVILEDPPSDCDSHQHDKGNGLDVKEIQFDSRKTVDKLQSSPSKDSDSGSDHLKHSDDKSITDNDIFQLGGNSEENVETTTSLSEDLDDDDDYLKDDGDYDDAYSSPIKKTSKKSQIQVVDTSDDDSEFGVLVIHEEPAKAQSSDDDQKSSSLEESPLKTINKKQRKSQKKSVDSDKLNDASSEDDEIVPVEHRGPKRRASAVSDESNDSSLNKSLHNNSLSGHQSEDEEEILSGSEDSVHSNSPRGKNQGRMKSETTIKEKKPRVLLKKVSAEIGSSNGTYDLKDNQNDSENDSDSESAMIDSDDEPLQKLQSVHYAKKAPNHFEKSGSSKENNSDSNNSCDSIAAGTKKKKTRTKSTSKKEPAVTKRNAKIEKLKKYISTAGIHVQSYNKLWESCNSLKAKADKLLELLQKNGLKGPPTIEKCKKLKKKIEKKKEVQELDLSNIIKSEGRPKRNARSMYLTSVEQTPVEPTKKRARTFSESDDSDPQPLKKFSRLRDIIDSEESD